MTSGWVKSLLEVLRRLASQSIVMQSEKRDQRFLNVEISIRADRAGKCLCNAVLSIHIPHSMTKL